MEKELENIGLTPIEAKIYLALIDLGRTQAGVLSRKTGIHRRSIYDALDRLIEKGIVSYIVENNKRYYIPSHPDVLKAIADRMHGEVTGTIDILSQRYSLEKERQETVFYRGKQGIRSVFDDQIVHKEPVYVIGGRREAADIMQFYLKHYTRDRITHNIKLFLLVSGTTLSDKIPLSEIRYLPENYFGLVATNIWADRVAIIIWRENPACILIKDKEVADSYMNYFKMLWKLGKK
ncbi:MAG: helix-turn-helix domain-containing protein [Nanoarchaeota archaeon]